MQVYSAWMPDVLHPFPQPNIDRDTKVLISDAHFLPPFHLQLYNILDYNHSIAWPIQNCKHFSSFSKYKKGCAAAHPFIILLFFSLTTGRLPQACLFRYKQNKIQPEQEDQIQSAEASRRSPEDTM